MNESQFWDYAGRLLELAGRKHGGRLVVAGWFWDMAALRAGLIGGQPATGVLFGYPARVNRALAADALGYVA